MRWMRPLTDPGYYLLKSKSIPLTSDEAEFV